MARRPLRDRPPAQKGMPVAIKDKNYIKWQETPGHYIAGKEALDEADFLGVEMDRKWGVGRLRLLVDGARREKFDRQRYLMEQARWTGNLEDVKREASRMVKAYGFLDKAATDAGKQPIDPDVWEMFINQGVFKGTVVAVVKNAEDVAKVRADGRYVVVYTLEEIGRLISYDHFSLSVKATFPGAEVVGAQRPIDPIRPSLLDGEEGIPDVSAPLDGIIGYGDVEELNDEVPF